MLAGDDQFAALAVDMAQRGFGGGDAVQPDRALRQLDIHGRISLLIPAKVDPLDRLINLDYINQYEKIRGAVSFRARSIRGTRDLAGHALCLCQPRSDPFRAVSGFAQPPLPRRGRPRPEGAPYPVARAARLAELRRGLAGDGFGNFDHHRERPDLSRRELRRSRGNGHAGACRDAVVGRHQRRSVCAGQLSAGVRRDARDCRSRAPRCADRPGDCRAGAGAQVPIPRAFTRADDGRAMVGARILRLVVATMLNTSPSAEPLHLQIAKAWAPDNKHAADLIRRALVLLAEHELNASTFTVRCAASTGLNLYDSIIAGLAALKGPKHGGAGVLASRLVKTLIDQDPEPVIRERVALGERFAGFGHGVYKRGDPRAMSLLERADARRRRAKIHQGSSGADRGSHRRIRQHRLRARGAGAQPAACRGKRTRAVRHGAQPSAGSRMRASNCSTAG